jgi:hypothetical protein
MKRNTISATLGIILLAMLFWTVVPLCANLQTLPFTREENADGARFVWFSVRNAGLPYEYTPCKDFPTSGQWREVKEPTPGDVVWWKQFVALYDPTAPEDRNVLVPEGPLSRKALEIKYGLPRYFRLRVPTDAK